jgi:hypothetical protein
MQAGEILKTRNYPNVNNVKTTKHKNNVNNVRAIAMRLSEKLKDDHSHDYFLKVAWHLPEATIWNNLEQAQTGKNPRAYFTFLCNLSLAK